MKKIIAALLFSILVIISRAQNTPDAILGTWITAAGNCKIEVYKQSEEFKAKIIWLKEDKNGMNDYKDEKNPDPALRSRNLLGIDVANGLHYDPEENEYVDGVIYDARSGRKWDSVVWLTDDNLLKVKGYWVFKFVSKTDTFKRE
ncbi:MAG: DUF2147 domain-containing protein [Ginsengibacter sp.]